MLLTRFWHFILEVVEPVNRFLFTMKPMRPIGRLIYALSSRFEPPAQATATQFFRNLEQLAVLDGPLAPLLENGPIRVLVAGCSKGCEAFTVAGYLRHRYPELDFTVDANDIRKDVLAIANEGIYGAQHGLGQNLGPLGESLRAGMFERSDANWSIVADLRGRVRFERADVLSPQFASYCDYDLVFGQNFMMHMSPEDEARAFSHLVAAARPGGALFVGGMHLDHRVTLARGHGLEPLDWNVAAIHEGDSMIRAGWPWRYWSLGPIDINAPDYLDRYATVFVKGGVSDGR